MGNINLNTPIGTWIADLPAAIGLLEGYGIDVAADADKPLSDVCARLGLDAPTLSRALEAVALSSGDERLNVDRMSMTALADHIERYHHDYLRQELPRLRSMIQQTCDAAGARDARLRELASLFDRFIAEVEEHLRKEEILFPQLRAFECAQDSAKFAWDPVAESIEEMGREHDGAVDAVQQMRALTDEFVAPSWADVSHRALLHALSALDGDMHDHIYKEDHVLFPQVTRLDAMFAGR